MTMFGESPAIISAFSRAASRGSPANDQPLEAWLKRELGREFDEALYEKIPEELLDLLEDRKPTRH